MALQSYVILKNHFDPAYEEVLQNHWVRKRGAFLG